MAPQDHPDCTSPAVAGGIRRRLAGSMHARRIPILSRPHGTTPTRGKDGPMSGEDSRPRFVVIFNGRASYWTETREEADAIC